MLNPLQQPAHMPKPKFKSRQQFENALERNVSQGPVSSARLLKGRSVQLKKIDRAFASPRQHLFIIGERGVGKTSLALTAWKNRFGQDREPLSVFCDPRMSFDALMQAVCSRILGVSLLQQDLSDEASLGFDFKIISGGLRRAGSGQFMIPSTFGSADFCGQFLKAAAKETAGGAEVCIILDEFDRLPSGETQDRVADLIKVIHDQSIPIRFICCGVSDNIRDLLGAHQSAGRSIIPVEVPRLSVDSLASIIFDASEAMGINVPRELVIRACQISDGFPYFVHLLAKHLFFEVYEHIQESNSVSSQDFHRATHSAIEAAEYELRDKYDNAVRKAKNSRDYEEVLWAFSDGQHFERQIREAYEGSYLRMRGAVRNSDTVEVQGREQSDGEDDERQTLSYDDFSTRVRRLLSGDHGAILLSPRRGWYRFYENRLRGFVRLVAESHDIQLGSDHF